MWGSQRTSIPALPVELGEIPLRLWRLKLVLNYLAKVEALGPDHPSKAVASIVIWSNVPPWRRIERVGERGHGGVY